MQLLIIFFCYHKLTGSSWLDISVHSFVDDVTVFKYGSQKVKLVCACYSVFCFLLGKSFYVTITCSLSHKDIFGFFISYAKENLFSLKYRSGSYSPTLEGGIDSLRTIILSYRFSVVCSPNLFRHFVNFLLGWLYFVYPNYIVTRGWNDFGADDCNVLEYLGCWL